MTHMWRSMWRSTSDFLIFDELDTIGTQSAAISDAAKMILGGLRRTEIIKSYDSNNHALEFENMHALKEFIKKYPEQLPLHIYLIEEGKSYYVAAKNGRNDNESNHRGI